MIKQQLYYLRYYIHKFYSVYQVQASPFNILGSAYTIRYYHDHFYSLPYEVAVLQWQDFKELYHQEGITESFLVESDN